ncbi:MAG: DUF4262 domain-containing protein [Planctomycetota bacterium]
MSTDKQQNIYALEGRGCHTVCIESSDGSPDTAFSVGLNDLFEHPEIIILGSASDVLVHTVGWAIHNLRRGKRFDSGELYDGFFDAFAVTTRPVNPKWHDKYFGYASQHLTGLKWPETLQAVQLLWPDKSGRFPWEEGCDEQVVRLQPLLDR